MLNVTFNESPTNNEVGNPLVDGVGDARKNYSNVMSRCKMPLSERAGRIEYLNIQVLNKEVCEILKFAYASRKIIIGTQVPIGDHA